MKNITYIILIASLALLNPCCGKDGGNKKATSYPQELVNALDKADAMALDAKIIAVKEALDSYYTDNNQYPETLEILVPRYLRSENFLVDPWGTRFTMEIDESGNPILISAGKDKTFGSADDIKRDTP